MIEFNGHKLIDHIKNNNTDLGYNYCLTYYECTTCKILVYKRNISDTAFRISAIYDIEQYNNILTLTCSEVIIKSIIE